MLLTKKTQTLENHEWENSPKADIAKYKQDGPKQQTNDMKTQKNTQMTANSIAV